MLESLVFIKGGRGSTGLSSLATTGVPCSSCCQLVHSGFCIDSHRTTVRADTANFRDPESPGKSTLGSVGTGGRGEEFLDEAGCDGKTGLWLALFCGLGS